MPYHVSIGVLCVLDGRDCSPGCDPLYRHPLLSMEFTCAYRLKVPYRTKHLESCKEVGSTFVFCVPTAYPNTTKQLVPHCYPFDVVTTCIRVSPIILQRARVSPEGGLRASVSQYKVGGAISC